MLPPPTTAATWTPSLTAAMISAAMCVTTSGEMPSGSLPANSLAGQLEHHPVPGRMHSMFRSLSGLVRGRITARPMPPGPLRSSWHVSPTALRGDLLRNRSAKAVTVRTPADLDRAKPHGTLLSHLLDRLLAP